MWTNIGVKLQLMVIFSNKNLRFWFSIKAFYLAQGKTDLILLLQCQKIFFSFFLLSSFVSTLPTEIITKWYPKVLPITHLLLVMQSSLHVYTINNFECNKHMYLLYSQKVIKWGITSICWWLFFKDAHIFLFISKSGPNRLHLGGLEEFVKIG